MIRPGKMLRNIRGFTLIEMIVVLSLVVISSSIVLFNYRGAREATILNSTALDVAGMIRLAQNGGRSASGYYDDNSVDTGFQESVIKINDNNNTSNTSLSTGILFQANGSSSDYWISDIIIYKNQDGNFGYRTVGQQSYTGGNDIELEVKKLTSTSPIKLYICYSVSSYDEDCPTYGGSGNNKMALEFTRLQSDPIVDPKYKSVLGANQPTLMLTSGTGADTIRKFIIVEKTGNIFVR